MENISSKIISTLQLSVTGSFLATVMSRGCSRIVGGTLMLATSLKMRMMKKMRWVHLTSYIFLVLLSKRIVRASKNWLLHFFSSLIFHCLLFSQWTPFQQSASHCFHLILAHNHSSAPSSALLCQLEFVWIDVRVNSGN